MCVREPDFAPAANPQGLPHLAPTSEPPLASRSGAAATGLPQSRKPTRMPELQRSVPGWLARTIARLAPASPPRRAGSAPSARRGEGLGVRRVHPTPKPASPARCSPSRRLRQPVWAPRDYAAFAREGFTQNAIVYRSVRMVAEAAASVPLLLYEGDAGDRRAPAARPHRPPQPRSPAPPTCWRPGTASCSSPATPTSRPSPSAAACASCTRCAPTA